MTNHSLNHIVLSPKELNSLYKIIEISCEAFELAKYPFHSYPSFLKTIHSLIQQGAMIASLTKTTLLRYHEFSSELDNLAPFMRILNDFYYRKL